MAPSFKSQSLNRLFIFQLILLLLVLNFSIICESFVCSHSRMTVRIRGQPTKTDEDNVEWIGGGSQGNRGEGGSIWRRPVDRKGSGGGGNARENRQRREKREFTKNNSVNERRGVREWQSGNAMIQGNRSRRRRNDPWWMREEESNNPRILPHYRPWWLGVNQGAWNDEERVEEGTVPIGTKNDGGNRDSIGPNINIGNVWVDESWKVNDLKKECERRGIKPAKRKEELIKQLHESSRLHDLSDAGFVKAIFTPQSFEKDLPCFPHVYETEESLAMLNEKRKLTPPPAAAGGAAATTENRGNA